MLAGERCNANKKLAGSIASPANEIVACRYTIRRRRRLAPAAPAPGCTAACCYPRHAYTYPTNAAATAADAASAGSAARATATATASAEATTASAGATASAAATASSAPTGKQHAAKEIFFLIGEETEGSKADVGNFLFTERDHHARCKIRPLNVGRGYGRCICTSC